MGNTVTCAEIAANNITNPSSIENVLKNNVSDKKLPPNHPPLTNYTGEIPKECPMHQQAKPEQYAQEKCPIDHNNKEEINPLNMVIIKLTFIIFID